jgi:ribose transport system substrate-binding protein
MILLVAGYASQPVSGANLSKGHVAAPLSAGVSEARAIVRQLERPVKWQKPGPAFKLGNRVRGKTVYFLANGLSFPFVQNLLAGLKEAARVGHMGVLVGDGNGSVPKAASLIEQAVGRRANVIVDEGFPSSQLSAPIQRARAARIPVIEIGSGTPGLPPAGVRRIGVSAWVTFCYGCAGRQMADSAVAQSGGHVDGLIVNVPGISVAQTETNAILSELHRLCPNTCKAKVVDAPLAEWSTLLPSLTSSNIQRDTSLNYLFPLFDSMVALMGPSVTRLSAQSRVKFVSYNATLPPMQQLKQGQLVAGDIGSPQHWLGWAIMDQTFRILTHQPVVANEKIPNRLFDATNIGSVNLKASEDTWYGPTNFRQKYRKLWGM